MPTSRSHMVRIVLTTYGSSGDLNPIVALGLGLQVRGHAVLMAVEESHRAAVMAAGLPVHPLSGDNDAVLLPYRRALFNDLSPLTFAKILLERSILPALPGTVEALRDACNGADLLISTVQQAAAGIVAELTRVPWVSLALSPMTIPSAAIALHPSLTMAPRPLQPLVNRTAWAVTVPAARRLGDGGLNRVRTSFGLHPRRDALLRGNRSPSLTAVTVSPAFFPRPLDWPPYVRPTGFLFWDTPTTWAESAALADFLAAPGPVVAVSSGSMSPLIGDIFADFYRTSMAAIRQSGARALVVGAPPEALPATRPADVLAVPFAPFSTVYPRCAAVIHHGGIGTTAQGLRAGVPALVAPWGVDQYFDGMQVARLGAGRWLPRRRYTVARAAAVLTALLHQPVYRAQAGVVAGQIAREDGVATLCAAIEDLLRRTTRHNAVAERGH